MLSAMSDIRRKIDSGSANTFVITGNVGDLYPVPESHGGIKLVTLAECVERMVATAPFLELDVATGLACRSEASRKMVDGLLAPGETTAQGDSNDLARAMRQMAASERQDDGVLAPFDQAVEILLRLWRQDEVPITVFAPRLAALLSGHGSVSVRLLDALLSLAARGGTCGHAFVGAASLAASLPPEITRPDSHVAVIRLRRPSDDERLKFIRSLVVTRELQDEVRSLQERLSNVREAAQAEKAKRLAAAEAAVKSARADLSKVMARRQTAADEVRKSFAERLDSAKRSVETGEDELAAAKAAKKSSRSAGLAIDPESLPVGGVVVTEGKKGYVCLRRDEERGLAFGRVTEDGSPPQPICVEDLLGGGKLRVLYWHWDHSEAKYFASNGLGCLDPSDVLVIAEGPEDAAIRVKRISAAAKMVSEAEARVTKALIAFAEVERELSDGLSASDESLKRMEAECHDAIDEAEKVVQEIKSMDSVDVVEALKEEHRKVYDRVAKLTKNLYPHPDMTLREAATATGGLGYRDIKGLLALAGHGQRPLTRQDVFKAKEELIVGSFEGSIRLVDPAYGFEGIGGMNDLKRVLSGAVSALRSGDVVAAPSGVMLMGPPGTGKTAIATALAHECGFALVEVMNTRSMWVGQSEAQTEAVLEAIRSLAPVVVLRDEVDEEDSGRDSYQGDSGVSGRIRRLWMSFLSDPAIRGRVLVVSCTNRPDRIDAAMKRDGRTDLRVPVLMPDEAARERIFEVMFSEHRYNITHTIRSFRSFARDSEGWSGASIERVVLDSRRLAVGYGVAGGVVSARILREAMEDFLPASASDINRQTWMAIEAASHRRFLPAPVAKGLERPVRRFNKEDN